MSTDALHWKRCTGTQACHPIRKHFKGLAKRVPKHCRDSVVQLGCMYTGVQGLTGLLKMKGLHLPGPWQWRG